ncbi:hypothetical protein B7463_g1852, partial [Scytalidium lignicola]
MGSLKSRAARSQPVVKGKLNARYYRPRRTSFRHIQTKPAPEQEKYLEHGNQQDFIYKESIQLEIKNRLAKGPFYSSTSVCLEESPKTFAKAIISTSYYTQTGTRCRELDTSLNNISKAYATLDQHRALRVILKKKKDRAISPPFDVSSIEGISDVGRINGSRTSSPVPATPQSPPQCEELVAHKPDSDISNAELVSKTLDIYPTISASIVSPQPNITPSISQFDSAVLKKLSAESIVTNTSDPDRLDDNKIIESNFKTDMDYLGVALDDTKLSVNRDDWFDSLEWNSSLAVATLSDDSPEPLTITPQKVTYTTVGSLVDPNSAPRFSAPNRVQREREVSGRKSYGTSSTHNSHESYYQPKDPFALQSATRYAEHLARNADSFYQNTPLKAPSSITSHTTEQYLSVNHLQTPLRIQSGSAQQARFKNMQRLSATPTLTKQLFGRHDHSLIENMEKELGRSGSLYGIRNSHTAGKSDYSSSSFQDTVREDILNFEYNLRPQFPTIGNQSSNTIKHPISNNMVNNKYINLTKSEHENHNSPSCSSDLLSTTALKSSLNSATYQYSTDYRSAIDSTKSLIQSHLSGYPQPLTAGPPGRRQYVRGLSNNIHSRNTSVSTPVPSTNVRKQQGLAISLPALEVVDSKRALDTLPIPLASKYFPYGLPGDMSGKFKPLSVTIRKQIEQSSAENIELYERNDDLKKAREIDEWFYSGQIRLSMTADDYIQDMENFQKVSQWRSINGLLGLADKSTEKKPLTLGELNRITVADSAAPFLDAAFGTLLSSAYRIPSSAGTLSNFRPALPNQIDFGEGGNSSFFSKDYRMSF